MSEGTSQPDSLFGADAINRVPTEEMQLLMALRDGNEAAFVALIDQYHRALLRLAMVFVSSKAVAEEVVQDHRLLLARRQ